MDVVVQIRPARADDLKGVGRVHARSRSAAYAGLVPAEALARVTPDAQAAVWRERVAAAPSPAALLVAVHGAEVQGFTFGTAAGRLAELRALHVLPERHGDGTGQALHEAVLAEFTAWGCTAAQLWVVRGNERAQSFYRRNGWRYDGRTSEHDIAGAVVPILHWTRAV
jgi:GNAT superfamily N-acetyltransferase